MVSIVDTHGHEFARGITNYDSEESRSISGLHSNAIEEKIGSPNYDAVITRDNVALLEKV